MASSACSSCGRPLSAAAPAIERIARRARHLVLLTSPHRTPHPLFQQPNALAPFTRCRATDRRFGPPLDVPAARTVCAQCRNWWAPQIRAGDVVRWCYAEAATAPVHERDLAAVAVRALCEEGHDGSQYVLTGPRR